MSVMDKGRGFKFAVRLRFAMTHDKITDRRKVGVIAKCLGFRSLYLQRLKRAISNLASRLD